VLDSQLKIPIDCKIIRTAKKAPVLVFTTNKNNKKTSLLKKKGAEIIPVPSAKDKCDLKTVLAKLAQRDIRQILVEGGPTVITSFLKQGLADEICVYIAPKILGSQGTAGITQPMAELSEAVGLYHVDVKHFGNDVRITGFSKKAMDKLRCQTIL
jgi:riboflavin-specific deaminase-like protein